MYISKLLSINFGMPRFTDNARKYFPENLSGEDKKKLEKIEGWYPNAQLDIEDRGEGPKRGVKRVIYGIEGKLNLRKPRFQVVVHETFPNIDGKFKKSGVCTNGEFYAGDSEDRSLYVERAYPVNREKISLDDCLAATGKFDEDCKYANEMINQE